MWLVVLLPAALTLSTPRAAHACSPPLCFDGAIAPSDLGTVPASFPGIYWRPLVSALGDGVADPTKVTITTGVDATPIPFTVTALSDDDYLLVPDAPLVVGERYQVTDATTCEGSGEAGPRGSFEVRPATRLPTTLGSLTASKQVVNTLAVETRSGSCTTDVIAAQRSILLTLDLAAEPWGDLLQYQAFINGRPWGDAPSPVRGPLGSRSSGARLQLFQTCSTMDSAADSGLAKGRHEVQLRATLPGTSLRLASNTIKVELECPAAVEPPKPRPEPGDGHSVGDDAGCRASGGASPMWLGLVLGALLVRRPRRRSAR